MKKTILFFIAFLSISNFANSASANIEFSIHVHQTTEKKDSDNKILRDENRSEMLVNIGDGYFSYTSKGTKYIYDFTKKRVLTIDMSKRIFSDDSLFSNIGFREYEFKNRLMLGGALAAAKIEDNPMQQVLSEHLFSLQKKDAHSKLSQTLENDFLLFAAGGKELLSYSRQGEQVAHKDKETFVKFFRYVFGGHPQILDKLLSDDVIPKSIRIHRYNMFHEINALTISAIKNTPKKSFSIEGNRPGVLSNDSDEFSIHLNKIKHSKNMPLENHLKLLLSRAEEHYKNGHYMDTMLAYLEYNLVSGLPFPSTFHEQKAILIQNRNVKQLLASLSPKSKEKAEQFLSVLQNLEKASKQQSHVLKIFEANIQMSLRHHQEAKELFYKALKINPYITGAYKDLGGIYFNEYNAVLAWRCWDVARKIAPTHKMLTQINKFETRLSMDHPEFF